MPFIPMPASVSVPWMHSDVGERFWRPWTNQPGEARPLCIEVQRFAGPLPTEALASQKQAAADSLPRFYLPDGAPSQQGTVQLRDYQRDAIQALQGAWASGRRAPLIVLPTGSGKTICAAETMSRAYIAHGSKGLFLAHRRELLDQTADKIRVVSPETRVGIVQANRNELGRDITVASIQTLGHRSEKRLAELLAHGPYQLIACDEAHHAVSPQWIRVLDAVREQSPNCAIFGMTATPCRADGTALDRVFDDICYSITPIQLIEQGYLVPPRGFRVDLGINLDRIATNNGDFVQTQLGKVMNTDRVNDAVVQSWLKYGHDRKTAVFCVDINHAHALCHDFIDAGYKAEVVSSKTKTALRKAIFARFHSGETKLLVQCEVAVEGWDEPSLECVLMARPTQSQTFYVQSIGRGLRPYPGKTECLVIDCVGNSDKHQLIQLATLAGFDPVQEPKSKTGSSGDDIDDEIPMPLPSVLGTHIHGREIDLTGKRAAKYRWCETEFGWVLQIPRIGYYLVGWSTNAHQKCVVRFYDQRPGRRDSPPREVLREPVPFELAYGLVEAEMDRILNAGDKRDNPRWSNRQSDLFETEEDPSLRPEMSFVDLDEGLDEEIHVAEAHVLNDAAWRYRPRTTSQANLLRKLGVKPQSLPETMGEASDLITIMQVERDAKMRLPATGKQLSYLRVNHLPIGENLTKGAASRLIWKHRKGIAS